VRARSRPRRDDEGDVQFIEEVRAQRTRRFERVEASHQEGAVRLGRPLEPIDPTAEREVALVQRRRFRPGDEKFQPRFELVCTLEYRPLDRQEIRTAPGEPASGRCEEREPDRGPGHTAVLEHAAEAPQVAACFEARQHAFDTVEHLQVVGKGPREEQTFVQAQDRRGTREARLRQLVQEDALFRLAAVPEAGSQRLQARAGRTTRSRAAVPGRARASG
jgi:hypothetical protein